MIIDFHTHIFPEKIAAKTIDILAKNSDGVAYTDGTVGGLIDNMVKGGVDISVALPVLTKPEQFDGVTRFITEINERYKECDERGKRIISFGGIHPACTDIKGKMKTLKNLGVKGVKIHPDYQETFIDDVGYAEILQAADELDMIVVTHAGIDNGYIGKPVRCPPELTLKVIDKIHPKRFVLAHYGAHKQWEGVFNVLAGKDVYLDTAFTLHEIEKSTFIDILNRHGDDKILFATDCPWRDMKEDVETLKSFCLPKETQDKIFYKNAEKLLGL